MSLESFLTRILGYIQSAEEQYNIGIEALEAKESGWQDAAKAFHFFKLAVNQGHLSAHIKLGECYEYGIGTEQNLAESARLYRLAADKKCPEALSRLGDCYRTGIGVKQDFVEALRFYREASDQNAPSGQTGLGLCYENGLGVPQDQNKAILWYHRASEKGNAEAQYNLGRCYSHGIGLPQDHVKAAEYYELAAEQATEGLDMQQRKQTRPAIVEALFALACCYTDGRGVDKSDGAAQTLYRKAAHRGHAKACEKYAACFRADSDDSTNCSLSDHWQRKAKNC